MAWKWNPFTNNLDYYENGTGGDPATTVEIIHVSNFSALPDPTTVGLYDIYIVDAAQGTKWLPGSMGGTYYPAGAYYSNLVNWVYSESAGQATQVEVNAGTVTDKFVTPETFTNASKWNNFLNLSTYDSDADGVIDSSEREQIQVINKTGATLTKGTIVYIKSTSSSTNYPEVLKANANSEITSSKTIGAIYEDILDSAVGYIITSGQVHNLNTSSYNVGDKLWLSTTDGLVTTTIPAEPNHSVFIGHVTRSQVSNGRILYAIQNGYELDELHGVSVPSPSNNNVLYFDNATGLWKDKALSTSDLSDIQITSPIVNQLLQWNGSKWTNASSSVVNAGPGVIYFLTNFTAGFGTYEYMSKTPDALAEIEETVVVNANTVLVHEYISDVAINKTLIDAGIWEFNLFGYVNTLNANFVIETYKRTSGGTETLLFSVETDIINWTSTDLSNSTTVQQSFACNATDTLVIKIYGKTTQTSNVTLKLVHSGTTHYSHLHTPLTLAHNDIAGLQGGASGEYFHLNTSDNTKVTGWTTSGIPDLDIQSASTWDAKQDPITLTTTGSSGAATFIGSTLNIPQYTLGGSEFIFVNSKSDLPTAVSNVITLLDNITYYFTSLVDLTGDRLVGGINTTILGASSENCIIKSIGLSSATALITSSYSLPMRNITITHGTALNLVGDGITTALDWFGVNFTNCATVGTISNYTNFIMNDSAFLNSQGLTFAGTIGTIGMTNCLFDCSSGGTAMILPATLTVSRRFRIIYSSFVVLSGETGINASTSATIGNEKYILDTVNFSGGGTYLSGLDATSNISLFANCVGITNTSTKGLLYMINNATDTNIGVSNTNVWVKAEGATTSGSLSKFTHTDNRLTYTGAFSQSFMVHVNASVRSGGTNQVISIGVAKNGTILLESEMTIRTNVSNQEYPGSTLAVMDMVATNFIELFVKNTSSTNIRVSDLNMNIVKIPV